MNWQKKLAALPDDGWPILTMTKENAQTILKCVIKTNPMAEIHQIKGLQIQYNDIPELPPHDFIIIEITKGGYKAYRANGKMA